MRTDDFNDRLEQATRARLARLATTPQDTSRLERQLEGAMTGVRPAPASRVLRWWAPLAGVAAVLLVSATIGGLFLVSNDAPVVATSSLLAGLHHEVTGGGPFSIPVADVDSANHEIATRWSNAPALPNPADCEFMSCCVHEVEGRKIACVLLRLRGKSVTMVVANSKDLTPADGIETTTNQHPYTRYAKGDVNMVCMQKNGTNVWLVGELPHEELAQLLSKEWTTS